MLIWAKLLQCIEDVSCSLLHLGQRLVSQAGNNPAARGAM
jgi:hypothetical protein